MTHIFRFVLARKKSFACVLIACCSHLPAPGQANSPLAGEASEAQTIKVEAEASSGFTYPYYLFIPANFGQGSSRERPSTILVMPNNSGRISDDLAFHENGVKSKLLQGAAVFGRLNAAILMPVFPRPESEWKIYTHALDRDSLATEKKEYKRFDLQLAAMIDHARARLGQQKIHVDERVLIYGYSASGMFANRFTFLHPDRVKAAAIGSPGGWPIAPLGSYKSKQLRYPVGVADLKDLAGRSFRLNALRKVRIFVFVGDKDANDSVVFRDGYEEEDEKLIFELFGRTPIERWQIGKSLYDGQKLNATFKLYEGVEHKVTSEMIRDILTFFDNKE